MTGLAGLPRTVRGPSTRLVPGDLCVGPFVGLPGESLLVANGAGPEEVRIAAGEARTLVLRHVSRGDGAHASRLRIEVAEAGRLTLLESHEGGGAGLSLLGIDLSPVPYTHLTLPTNREAVSEVARRYSTNNTTLTLEG